MKKISNIDPELEYENAKKLIEAATKERLDPSNATLLDSSVDNLITATRILIEREERRRGLKHPPKNPKNNQGKKGRKEGNQRNESKKLPSKRYPNLEIKEQVIHPAHVPSCPCCNERMRESGLFDTSEKLEVIPKKYYIVRNKRPKYNCSKCHGGMVNTPAVPSIVPASNYGDSLIIDASLSKYCDLIPMERYVQIAFRLGIDGLPAQSLIGLSHHLANFLFKVYEKIKIEVLNTKVLHADETTHKMLEGDDTKNWYLWGFFSNVACVFEAHNTRSGDIAYDFIKESKAKYLVSDGYTGYNKALKKLKEKDNKKIIDVGCNAHAYRYFKEASLTWEEECKPFKELYGKIYQLEKTRKKTEKTLSLTEQLEYRTKMIPIFKQFKKKCEHQKDKVMAKSHLQKSINYFLNHYESLTHCTLDIEIPLDNNLSEREIRSPVIGRKTWYGTHSKRGAKTNSILFSIVQTCKMNNINPRNYFDWVVKKIHKEEEILTPYEYSKLR